MLLIYGNMYTTFREYWDGERPTDKDMFSLAVDYLQSIDYMWRNENGNLPSGWNESICWDICMGVKELIEKLKEYPEDMVVEISASYDDGYGRAGGKIEYIEEDKTRNAIILCNDYD